MKQNLFIYALGALLAIGATGCVNEDFNKSLGEGKVLLTATINSDVKLASRAAADPSATEEELAAECLVWLSNSKGVVYRYQGLHNIPADGIKLLADHYTAEAWTGDSVSASWDRRWFKGRTEFDVTSGQTTRVALQCKIANTLVTVQYAESVDDVLQDYTMTVGHTRGNLTFTGRSDATAYFMMPNQVTQLDWKLEGKLKADGSTFTREGTITDVKQAYKYNLKVSCDPDDSGEFGGANFTVEVDPTEIELNETVDIVLAPQIEGYNFDLSKTITGASGKMEHYSLFIKSGTTLENVILESEDFPEMLGFGEGEFDVDLLTAMDQYKQMVADGGITATYMPADDGTSMMKIRFEESFTNKYENGRHTVKIIARDKNGKETTATVRFNISDAKASTEDIHGTDVWTYNATLRGTVLVDGATNVFFRYHVKGAADWQTIEPQAASRATFAKDTDVEAELTDLSADTEYEYQLVVDDYEGTIASFRTGTDAQLPNASFEGWQQNTGSSPWLIYGAGEEMFWDSGNHGSMSLGNLGGVNITSPITSNVHDGEKSAQLKSAKVVIKFAAGNIFIGEYLRTDGTDGVLGWGRPFTGRPKQIKVWAHYTSSKINNIEKDAPSEYKSGDPDKGIIYAALMDGNLETDQGKKYPVVIRTKASERRLFDAYGKDKPHVIAYGEHVFTENTPGSDLVEVTMDLDYTSFGNIDVTPSYIILTASASKGGDYFTGGAGSTLILDDIKLVY